MPFDHGCHNTDVNGRPCHDMARTADALVLDRKGVLDATGEILGEFGIRKPCSDDLKGVFETK